MTDTHSEETLEKARELLYEMVALVNNKPFGQSHSDFITRMWNAFNKGREYEKLVATADTEDEKIETKSFNDITVCIMLTGGELPDGAKIRGA